MARSREKIVLILSRQESLLGERSNDENLCNRIDFTLIFTSNLSAFEDPNRVADGPSGDSGDGWTSATPSNQPPANDPGGTSEEQKICDAIECLPEGEEKEALLTLKEEGRIFVSCDYEGAHGFVQVAEEPDEDCTVPIAFMVLSLPLPCESWEDAATAAETKHNLKETLIHEAIHVVQAQNTTVDKYRLYGTPEGRATFKKWISGPPSVPDPDCVFHNTLLDGLTSIFVTNRYLDEMEAHSLAPRIIEPTFFATLDKADIPNYCVLSDEARERYRSTLEANKHHIEDYRQQALEWLEIARQELEFLAAASGVEHRELVDRLQAEISAMEERLAGINTEIEKLHLLCWAVVNKSACDYYDCIVAEHDAACLLLFAAVNELEPKQDKIDCIQAKKDAILAILIRSHDKIPNDSGSGWKNHAFDDAKAAFGDLPAKAQDLKDACSEVEASIVRLHKIHNKINYDEIKAAIEAAIGHLITTKQLGPDFNNDGEVSHLEDYNYRLLCATIESENTRLERVCGDKDYAASECDAIESAEAARWSQEEREENQMCYDEAVRSTQMQL